MSQIPLDSDQIQRVKNLACSIADKVQAYISEHSTVSVERTILRLYGVDGVDDQGVPLPNLIIEKWQQSGDTASGISPAFAAVMIASGLDVQQTAEALVAGRLDFASTSSIDKEEITKQEMSLAELASDKLLRSRQRKNKKIEHLTLPPQPWKYLIVATGNIYEDRTQAESAIYTGADIIAVIRSTAQSLLDYVPYGPTTEGFGGTYATQENFRIMREAIDDAAQKHGRYVRLVNYASGLCMAEIAACAALEDLDMLLNDSMYGILFRDINMKRTFIDQYFSRLICAKANIIINTGEDNYLTTADAIEAAHTVTASQLINEAMAKEAGLHDDLLGLGHAFEIDPNIENAFLYELSHALLAKELFPKAPLKYMPPTKHKSTDIFSSHGMDTLFNLASIMTDQGIHLTGMLTEALHTPLMQDRFKSISNVNYVFNVARSLKDEIEYKKDGFVVTRAQQVLDETEKLLQKIDQEGLMESIASGHFANITRPIEGGKGLEGVFRKGPGYSNPIMDLLEQESI